MAGVRESQGQMVFGLDIGTRSVVGTVGYLAGTKFHILGQRAIEHETRAMLDGQIHDIGKVGATIKQVKELLEEDMSRNLTEVCIAAAGRVLRTVTTHVEESFEQEKEITDEDIYALSMNGIEKAYGEFQKDTNPDVKFYCVGYTPMRYYLNSFQIGNLEGHKARSIGADLIATFLPDDVVDGLYKAVDIAGLHVSNLTLEPIAAIQVAIPEKFRLLNLALVDVGAGTSDISITREGTIVAYGMIPNAGDCLTDVVVQHCLVDFETAEKIKRAACLEEPVEYTDILGLPQTITPEEILNLLDDTIDAMATQVADEIKKLNGDKSVSAVFVVGGGGTIPGYTQKLSEKLGIMKERVAIRGEEVMQNIVFELEDARKDSLMVTPIGICMSYYEQSNNFIFVDFNGEKLKLYDNGRLSVSDAAIQVSLSNEDLFPKRGEALTFSVNGKSRIVRGQQGEAAVIRINGNTADMHTQIHSGDVIEVIPSTMGEPAVMELRSLPEMSGKMRISVNGKLLELPRTADVGGQIVTEFYSIASGDEITIHNYYTVKEIAKMLDLPLGGGIVVNGTPAKQDTKVYEDFTLDIDLSGGGISYEELPEDDGSFDQVIQKREQEEKEEKEKRNSDLAAGIVGAEGSVTGASNDETGDYSANAGNVSAADMSDAGGGGETATAGEAQEEAPVPSVPRDIQVIANKLPVTMTGKVSYVFVDIFNYISFDLKASGGRSIVTLLNGRPAEYMEELKDGDVIDIYWK